MTGDTHDWLPVILMIYVSAICCPYVFCYMPGQRFSDVLDPLLI